jgi:hypothetical protein
VESKHQSKIEEQKQIHEAWCDIQKYDPGVCDCNDIESVVSDNEINEN